MDTNAGIDAIADSVTFLRRPNPDKSTEIYGTAGFSATLAAYALAGDSPFSALTGNPSLRKLLKG